MQDSENRQPPTSRYSIPIVPILLAAITVGCCLGIVMANRDTIFDFKRKLVGQINWKTSPEPGRADAENPPGEYPDGKQFPARIMSEDISTGLSSIGIIRYSPQEDSTQLAFDLEDIDLVRSEKLANPDRVYVDLQDARCKRSGQKLLRAQKTFSIDGALVTRVRLIQQETGALRVVLDLNRSCDYTYRISTGQPSRLIVELRPHAASPSVSKTTSS